MAKTTNKNELEQICNRLDQLTQLIEKNFNEFDDISDIKSAVEDLRANLLKTIDERIEYILKKQFDVYTLQINQIEDNIKTFSANNKSNKEDSKKELLSLVSSWKKELFANIRGVDEKLDFHLKDQINWKQIIATALVSGIISITLMISVILLDGYFDWGIANSLQKIK